MRLDRGLQNLEHATRVNGCKRSPCGDVSGESLRYSSSMRSAVSTE